MKELFDGEYVIPEGYTASIENGKIIVKKEEGENERIRKELLEHCKNQAKPYIQTGNKCPQIQSWIDWLEKKGEKIKLIENFDTEFEKQVSYLIASATNREYEYTEDFIKWAANGLLEYAKHEVEKQCEQKPTDEEMKILLQTEYEKGRADAIEQMSVWSEEDENTIKFLISHFCTCHPTRTFQFTINKVITHDELLRKIRHLKHQSTWKPSDEQISALDEVYKTHGANSACRRVILRLLNDLKKL